MDDSQPSSGVLRTIGGLLVLIGAWSAILPYVGPLFDYPMPPGSEQPAWQWTASHFQLHLLPGVVMVAGGLMLLGRGFAMVVAGAVLGLLAGAWHSWGPFISDAWLGGGGGGGGGGVSTAMQILTPLGYHWVPGVLAVALSAFALGRAARRRDRADEADRERRPAAVPAAEREREPVS